jgi:predicted nucleotidyltransferase
VELSKVDIQFLKSFFSKKPVKKAYLFGSYSRGAADQHSDVDILVELDYTQHIGLGFIKMKYEIEDALNKRVDLISEQSLSKHIRPFIAEDKQLIYER